MGCWSLSGMGVFFESMEASPGGGNGLWEVIC